MLQLVRGKLSVDAALEERIRSQPVDALDRLVLEIANARDGGEARAAIDRLGT